MGEQQLSSAAFLNTGIVCYKKVNTVNYTPHKDEGPCEIKDGVHKLSPNRIEQV